MQYLFLRMLLFYLPAHSPRISYITEWMFTRTWRIPFHMTHDLSEFIASEANRINYSEQSIPGVLNIIPSGLLADTSLKKWDVGFELQEGMPVLFSNQGDLGFDIFSAAFYMLSRYEEYLPFEPDEHGRFPAKASLAFQNSFLEIPIVEVWLDKAQKALLHLFPDMEFASLHFTASLTYDIDVAYKYRGRNMVQWTGGASRELLKGKIDDLVSRIATLFKGQRDPWNVYEHLEQKAKETDASCIFFLPSGGRTRNDRNISYRSSAFRNLVRQVQRFGSIGLHPSYISSQKPKLFAIEKERLESVIKKPVTRSRQHFLRFSLPDTLSDINAAGIEEDYSMAFPDAPGFRAGTCRPFPFYDLKKEETTSLLIFPAACMDFTFYSYLNMPPREALQVMVGLLQEVQRWKGHFIPIFHNNLLALPEWREIHDQLLSHLSLETKDNNPKPNN